MTRPTIVIMPGDGIGRVVMPEALRVLQAVGFEADYVQAEVGWDCFVRTGTALPRATVDLLREHRVGLFGAITSKSRMQIRGELGPEAAERYSSPILGLRQQLGLEICLRPCRTWAGNPLNFVRRDTEGVVTEPEIDVLILRQNTEGLYVGLEWNQLSAKLRAAFEEHDSFAAFADEQSEDMSVSVRLFTRRALRSLISHAAEVAKDRGAKKLTICDKANVLRATGGMLHEEASRVGEEQPWLELEFTNIDAQMMWLTKRPEDYRVIVASNFCGDIVSDAFAGLVGGLGFAPSANLGANAAVFEPTHGSAPDYAALEPPIVNPVAMILSAAMMLDHLGENARAERIRGAIGRVVSAGRVRTYDMLRLPGGAGVLAHGAASTTAMTDAIVGELST